MTKVRPKKALGQHFLKDQDIARKIADLLKNPSGLPVVEIGPGMGVLTRYLIESWGQVIAYEIDLESVIYLNEHMSTKNLQVLHQDYLKSGVPVGSLKHCLIGNLPYNISSQILFKMLESRDSVHEAVFMMQKEVAERIASPPGNKSYGIPSVLLQAYFNIEYCFTVEPNVFVPPPKVRSGVIRMERNKTDKLPCDESLFFRLVKQGFNNRRKTLRNALKGLNLPTSVNQNTYLDMRAEQLSYQDFVTLAQVVESAFHHK